MIYKNNTDCKTYEYDYFIRSSNPKEIIVVELKGYSGGAVIPKGSVEPKVPYAGFTPYASIRQFLFATGSQNGYKFRGCYITSGSFRPDGIAMLEELNKGSLKPALLDCFYNGRKLLGLVKKLDLEKAANILKRYYLPAEKPEKDSLLHHFDMEMDDPF